MSGLTGRENRMNEEDRAVARSCLLQVETGLEELRQLLSWWRLLSEKQRAELKEFQASVMRYRNNLMK
jgi:hypothetical protein